MRTTTNEAVDLEGGKPGLRARMRALRDRLPEEYRNAAGAAIVRHLGESDILRNAVAVGAYRGAGSEVGLDPLLERMLEDGKRIYLPRVGSADEVELCRVTILHTGHRVGRFGILEPTGKELALPGELEVILVPGIAFDPGGGRLGFGKGYYDRLLRRLGRPPVRVGVCYDCQVLPHVPMEHWDEGMDWLVTESELWLCSERRTES